MRLGLAVFDILTRPEPKLSKAQELEAKKVERRLLDKLQRETFILDKRLRETARADVRETIARSATSCRRSMTAGFGTTSSSSSTLAWPLPRLPAGSPD